MVEMRCKFGTLLSGAKPIMDRDILLSISQSDLNSLLEKSRDDTIVSAFTDAYDRWIRSSECNSITGFDRYDRYMVFAVTYAIEQFLMKYRHRRIRTFNGEYPGTTELLRGYDLTHSSLEEDSIRPSDAVIMSAPFSGSGNMHPLMQQVLDACDAMGVPVLIDCAFFGICKDLHLNERSCIETMAFSLSKCYGLNTHRIGMIYSRSAPFAVELLHNAGYTSRFGAALAIELFKKFSPDYIYSKYSKAQSIVCNELNLVPSNTVLFGNGDATWNKFNRGGNHNRVSFSEFLPELVTPNV